MYDDHQGNATPWQGYRETNRDKPSVFARYTLRRQTINNNDVYEKKLLQNGFTPRNFQQTFPETPRLGGSDQEALAASKFSLTNGWDLWLPHNRWTLRFHDVHEERMYQKESATRRHVSIAFGVLLFVALAHACLKFASHGGDTALRLSLLYLIPFAGVMIFVWASGERYWIFWKGIYGILMFLHVMVVALIGIYDVPNQPKWLLENLGFPRSTDILTSVFLIGADEQIVSITMYSLVNLAIANALGLDLVHLTPTMLLSILVQFILYPIHGLTPSYAFSGVASAAFLVSYLPAYIAERRLRHVYCLRRKIEKQLEKEIQEVLFTQQMLDSTKKELHAVKQKLAFDNYHPEEKDVVDKIFINNDDLQYIRIGFEELTLERQIGCGAFGEVISGWYAGTRVAIKRLLRNRITEDYMRGFARELELIMNLRHPNIVQLIGASWDSYSNICIVFEYMEKGDLMSVLASTDADHFTWADPKTRMAADAARGLAYLHSQKPTVIHRDMKSSNVLVSATFGCKLSDFGLSRQVAEDETLTITGSPLWFPPEMVRGDAYTEKADIYSFGIVLTELDTHKLPFYELKDQTGQNIGATRLMHMVAYENLRPKVSDNCMPSLRSLIEQCTSDNPDDRPTAAEVLRHLTEVVTEDVMRRLTMGTVATAASRVSMLPAATGGATEFLGGGRLGGGRAQAGGRKSMRPLARVSLLRG